MYLKFINVCVIMWALGNTMDRDIGSGDCSLVGQYRQTIGMFNSYKIKPGSPHKSIIEIVVEIFVFIKLSFTNSVNIFPIVLLHSILKLFIISALSLFTSLSITTLLYYSQSYHSTKKR